MIYPHHRRYKGFKTSAPNVIFATKVAVCAFANIDYFHYLLRHTVHHYILYIILSSHHVPLVLGTRALHERNVLLLFQLSANNY